MGDFLLTYNKEGKAYFRRLVYLNILLYIIGAIIIVVLVLDTIILIITVCIILSATILHILHFIYKNPPSEFDAGPSVVSE
ncbi:MAG: hypothetical protein E4H14_09270 [Candidatus Thorarchaeota archaeon]|nr:MAG: hypothetical protein E4H14_09270 [Candidatus Thorarchaeota archaeon]